MLSFFPRGVLDEILNLIQSVSEGFLSYSSSPKMGLGRVESCVPFKAIKSDSIFVLMYAKT